MAIAEFMQDLLTYRGFDVQIAHNGWDALALFSRSAEMFDLTFIIHLFLFHT